MSTLRQNLATIKRRYKERTGVNAIMHVDANNQVVMEMFPIWCSSPACIAEEEQVKLLNLLVTILDLYIEEDENAFQFIDAVRQHLPALETSIEGISWIHGYLAGVSGADISKLKLALFEEEDTEYEDDEE